jgi:hypothetical protein
MPIIGEAVPRCFTLNLCPGFIRESTVAICMSSLSILYFWHTLLISFSNAPLGTRYFFPSFAVLSRVTALRQANSMTN